MDKIIFASGADPEDMEIFPDLTVGWAAGIENTGSRKPKMAHMNNLFNRIDKNIQSIAYQGIIDFDQTVTYSKNSITKYQGVLYIAILDSTGKIPSDESLFWSPLIPKAVDGQPGLVKLNDTVTSTATDEAGTARVVKVAYDKAIEADNRSKTNAANITTITNNVENIQNDLTVLGNDTENKIRNMQISYYGSGDYLSLDINGGESFNIHSANGSSYGITSIIDTSGNLEFICKRTSGETSGYYYGIKRNVTNQFNKSEEFSFLNIKYTPERLSSDEYITEMSWNDGAAIIAGVAKNGVNYSYKKALILTNGTMNASYHHVGFIEENISIPTFTCLLNNYVYLFYNTSLLNFEVKRINISNFINDKDLLKVETMKNWKTTGWNGTITADNIKFGESYRGSIATKDEKKPLLIWEAKDQEGFVIADNYHVSRDIATDKETNTIRCYVCQYHLVDGGNYSSDWSIGVSCGFVIDPEKLTAVADDIYIKNTNVVTKNSDGKQCSQSFPPIRSNKYFMDSWLKGGCVSRTIKDHNIYNLTYDSNNVLCVGASYNENVNNLYEAYNIKKYQNTQKTTVWQYSLFPYSISGITSFFDVCRYIGNSWYNTNYLLSKENNESNISSINVKVDFNSMYTYKSVYYNEISGYKNTGVNKKNIDYSLFERIAIYKEGVDIEPTIKLSLFSNSVSSYDQSLKVSDSGEFSYSKKIKDPRSVIEAAVRAFLKTKNVESTEDLAYRLPSFGDSSLKINDVIFIAYRKNSINHFGLFNVKVTLDTSQTPDVVSKIEIGDDIFSFNSGNNYSSFLGWRDTRNTAFVDVKVIDQSYTLVIFETGFVYGVKGNSQVTGFILLYRDGALYRKMPYTNRSFNNTTYDKYYNNSYCWDPRHGFCELGKCVNFSDYGSKVVVFPISNDPTAIATWMGDPGSITKINSKNGKVIFTKNDLDSTKVYINSKVEVLINGIFKNLDGMIIDLKNIKSNPYNSTFYVYIVLNSDLSINYVVKESSDSLISDINTIFIGTIITNNSEVSEINIKNKYRINGYYITHEPAGQSIAATTGIPEKPSYLDSWVQSTINKASNEIELYKDYIEDTGDSDAEENLRAWKLYRREVYNADDSDSDSTGAVTARIVDAPPSLKTYIREKH